MKGFRRHIAASVAISAVFLVSALALSVPAVPTEADTIRTAQGRITAFFANDLTRVAQAVGEGEYAAGRADREPEYRAAAARPAVQPLPATDAPAVVDAPARQLEEPAAPSAADPEDEPRAGGVDPGLPAPSGLKAQFQYSRPRRTNLAWQGVSHPQLTGYVLLRWSGGDFDAMISIFRQLARIDPSLQGLVDGLEACFSLLSQPGWTYTERNDILAETGEAMDPLLAALATTPGAEDLLSQMAGIADRYTTAGTSYADTRFDDNACYLYVVSAAFRGGDVSLPSNCEGVFTVLRRKGPPPAPPSGLTAVAYDPGVALEWDRNTEVDLAGYDVYVTQGGSDVKLNGELIVRGTEFFHMAGLEGDRYKVYAVDIEGRMRNPARATAVLAPAVIYGVDDPAWVYAGEWAREDYSALEPDGRVLRVTMGAGNSASVTFTGRRVRVYSARYWSCGDVRFYIDGSPAGTFGLYYDGGYPDPPNPYVPALWQQMVFQVTGLSKGQHTLTIEAAGSGGEQGLSLINFEYAEVR